MAMATVRSALLRTTSMRVGGSSRVSLTPKRNFAASAHHDDARKSFLFHPRSLRLHAFLHTHTYISYTQPYEKKKW